MEQMTLRLRPKEVNKYVSIASTFGWKEISRVRVYEKGLDLGAYTPKNYKTTYKGKIVKVSFERDTTDENYKKLKQAEKEYVAIQENAVTHVTSTPLMVAIIITLVTIIMALVATGVAILGATLGRALVVFILEQISGVASPFFGFLQTVINILNSIMEALKSIPMIGENIPFEPIPPLPDGTIPPEIIAEVGKGTGIGLLFIIAIPNYFFDILNLGVASIIGFIGLIILFVRLLKFIIGSAKNSNARKAHKAVLVKYDLVQVEEKNVKQVESKVEVKAETETKPQEEKEPEIKVSVKVNKPEQK